MAVPSSDSVVQCCADFYASDYTRLLLGDALHPGGLALTERMGELLGLSGRTRALDVAAGSGASAALLADRFGCTVVAVDFGERNLYLAKDRVRSPGVKGRVRFVRGDAARLPFPDGAFDVVICECGYSTFFDRETAAAEFRRVLAPGGKLGFSDVTQSGPLPTELQSVLARVACLADACSADDYVAQLERAGFHVDRIEEEDPALEEVIRAVKMKLLSAELLAALGQLPALGADLKAAKALAQRAHEAVRARELGYVLMIARVKA